MNEIQVFEGKGATEPEHYKFLWQQQHARAVEYTKIAIEIIEKERPTIYDLEGPGKPLDIQTPRIDKIINYLNEVLVIVEDYTRIHLVLDQARYLGRQEWRDQDSDPRVALMVADQEWKQAADESGLLEV